MSANIAGFVKVADAMLDREAETTPLSLYERENLISDVLNELFGLGPLEELLGDPANHADYVLRGEMEVTLQELLATLPSGDVSHVAGIAPHPPLFQFGSIRRFMRAIPHTHSHIF
mgnify:CR=1 FL=1